MIQPQHVLLLKIIKNLSKLSLSREPKYQILGTTYPSPSLFIGGANLSNDDINCGEFLVNDMYRLNIYENDFDLPEDCKKWDPENPLCQVLGKYNLRLDSQPGQLPRYNYVDPYPGFANNCPTIAPDYIYPENC